MPSILQHTEHRPWPLPERPWSGFMRWSDLAFLHWPVAEDDLRRLIPAPLTLDTFDGQAWLGVVPFRMEGTRFRWAPPIPTATNFPEVNVRTYVRHGNRTGAWFFSLDAASLLAVLGARSVLNLPYFHATIRIRPTRAGIHYASRRSGRESAGAELRATYAPAGDVFRSAPGTLEHWLTERYCLFGRLRSGRVYYLDVHHLPWPLQPGAAHLERNTLSDAAGVPLGRAEPLVHFAASLDVYAWMPVFISGDRP